jgi:hypothetical protein
MRLWTTYARDLSVAYVAVMNDPAVELIPNCSSCLVALWAEGLPGGRSGAAPHAAKYGTNCRQVRSSVRSADPFGTGDTGPASCTIGP